LISEYVWDSIVHNHKYKTHKHEVGITSDIIALIRSHADLNHNFGVWSNASISEDKYGADIDLFVETNTNEFIWYALQAKVLKMDGAYERLSSKSQWEKLTKLKKNSGCIPFFLFYNGVNRPVKKLADCCGHDINEKQFGCSIVSIKDVKDVASEIHRPKYSDFCTKYMHPWRELVCCDVKRKNGTIYSLPEVQDAVALYERVLNFDILRRGSTKQRTIKNDLSIASLNEIYGRVPDYNFVVRSAAGLNQN